MPVAPVRPAHSRSTAASMSGARGRLGCVRDHVISPSTASRVSLLGVETSVAEDAGRRAALQLPMKRHCQRDLAVLPRPRPKALRALSGPETHRRACQRQRSRDWCPCLLAGASS